MPPSISTVLKVGAGWTFVSLSIPLIPYAFTDNAYLTRRKDPQTTKQLYMRNNNNNNNDSSLELQKFKQEKDLDENEVIALQTALACYNLKLKPKGDDFWKNGFSADAVQESPMYIHIGRERIGSGWRGVRSMFKTRNVVVKSLTKEIPPSIPNSASTENDKEQEKSSASSSNSNTTSNNPQQALFLELQTEVSFKSFPFLTDKWFKFHSSVEINTDKNYEKSGRKGITLMRHRWFGGGSLPGHVSLGMVNPLSGVFDGIRFVNGFVVSSIPFV